MISRERLRFLLALGGLLAVSIALLPPQVPSGNELVYLLAPWHRAHPGFLPLDWTFNDWGREHLVFDSLLVRALRLLPLVTVGWLGRVLCSAVVLAGLLRIGRHLGLGALAAAAAIALWLITGQSLLGAEWFIGTLEAKVVAYACLIWSIERLLDSRDRVGGLLLGLTFTLHASVGLQGGVGVLGGLLVLGAAPRRIGSILGWATLAALPGLLVVLPLVRGPGVSPADWRLLVLERMPWHLDALRFPPRFLVALVLSIGATLLYAARRPEPGWRMGAGLLGGLSLVFLGGVMLRVAEQWSLLQLFPFRLLPPFAALFLCFLLARLWLDLASGRAPVLVAVVALVAFLLPGNPLTRARNEWSIRQTRSSRPDDDPGKALLWVARHTPEAAIVLSPPQRKDAYLLSRRAQVVSWDAVPYNRLAAWRERLECLLGPLSDGERRGAEPGGFSRAYRSRSAEEMLACARRYAATFVVTPAEYPWPVRFQSGYWRVYQVP